MAYLLETTRPSGEFAYYTGRAGDGWISADVRDAFRCETAEFAAHRVSQFNARAALTGLVFEAVETRRYPQAA